MGQTKRPMTLCEKILCNSAVGLDRSWVQPGDMVCVSVDWTIASELTWKGMEKTFDSMNRPNIFRADRFWLAIDHTVDPSNYHMPKPKELIEASERFAKEAKLTDFHGPNQTILHTEFYRERALPGQMIIGADSHSCSAGGLGNFAVGLGAADVVMPLVTGETWFKVPETVEIRFEGQLKPGIGGKDVILYVLGELKRNTVAFERAVEYTGDGLKYLSCDARFAIANMTTEFGGIAGVFQADEVTAAYISKRKKPEYATGGLYFRADPDAQYVESHVIDLGQVDSMVALYPSPDNVVHVDKFAGTKLDGCFIGACTTGEEDLILAALVLEAGLKRGWMPSMNGKRKVTPGSVSIVAKLRRYGLLDIYSKAGFEIGAPGCSYCLGIAADKAGEGEVWLSSQNRNFKNRMGKGSIGNLASAATVAASSFDMKVMNPRILLDEIDYARFKSMSLGDEINSISITISEPNPRMGQPAVDSASSSIKNDAFKHLPSIISGKVQRFEDHIDTDAIIPAEFMPGTSDEDLGTHCFQYVRPEFRRKAASGSCIVVAGVGFGSGSSREEAPRALLGCGIKAVIAKSYAYIYGRNQPNMALLGVIVRDPKFYELAVEDSQIELDISNRSVRVGTKTFSFILDPMEEMLISGGGVTSLYSKFGSSLFRKTIEKSQCRDNDQGGCGDQSVESHLDTMVRRLCRMFYATAPQVDQKIIRRSFVKKKTRLTNPMTSNFENRKSENDALVRQILETVGNRLNPIIKLGPVDDSCSFIITDAFARITFVSKTFTQTTGYSADEVLGKNPRFLQSPGGNVDPGSVRKYSDNNVISHMKASIEKVKECQYSLVNYRKNGEPFINLVSIIPIRLYSNDVSHFLGLQIDLVEHPESIVERMNDGNYYVNYSRKDGVDYSIIPEDFTMAQSPVEEMPIPVFHSQFIDNCGDLVYILSIRGLVLYTSPKSCKDVLGFDSEELQGQHIAELVHPSDLVFVQRELRSSAPKEVINLICRFKTKNGGYTTLDLRGHVYQGEAGKRTRCIVMSGREKKTGSLLLSDILTPSLDDSEVWAKISPQGLFLFADPGSEDVFGVSPESIYAKSLLDFVNENDKVRVRQALEYASGVVRFFDIVNLPLNTPKGHIISHIRIYNLSDDTGVATKHLLLQIKLVVDSTGVNYRISTKTLTDFSQFFINGNILDYQDGSSSIYYEINQLRVENKKLRDRLDDYKKKSVSSKTWSLSSSDSNADIPLIYFQSNPSESPFSMSDDPNFFGSIM